MDASQPFALDDRIAGALRGDRGAWNALIAHFNPRVVAFLVARGTRIDCAKEIAHDAWAALMENQQRGKIRELKLPALVFQQAAYLAIDAARRARLGEVVTPYLPDATDPAPDVEAVLSSREELTRASAAFERCSAAERRVFRALYEQPDLSHREIAKALGLSEQRVKQVAYEVRKRLRAALQEAT